MQYKCPTTTEPGSKLKHPIYWNFTWSTHPATTGALSTTGFQSYLIYTIEQAFLELILVL